MRTLAIEIKSTLSKLTSRTLLIALSMALLSGCAGNFQLIGYGPNYHWRADGGDRGWKVYQEPREPRTPVEEAVVEVAQSSQTKDLGKEEIVFIMKDRAFRYVYLVEKTQDEGWLSDKNVTRYVVAGDKIAAMSERAQEPMGDADFERAVLIDASMVKSMDTVLIYSDKVHPVSMSSAPIGSCAAEVRIFPEGVVGGKPVATKIVNYCSLRHLVNPNG
ncbi:hypothetical protein [Geomesophilobacter sediminis]|uniref:Lipoprotein n=1 Tax=Geomesophilobacter sediminis TaxID=2798584 RepID=A0A8J7JDY9_9BACT|nr:hypothetical protein [Geomesophilobacter sediminis]MBJ6725528.1 hypothetical protein [Geomesophilobacter sediminis]